MLAKQFADYAVREQAATLPKEVLHHAAGSGALALAS